MSLYRALSPYPSYLTSAWLDSKKLLADHSFISAREELNRRARALLAGIPVKDHRALLKELDPAQWREIEETVDGFGRLLPQFKPADVGMAAVVPQCRKDDRGSVMERLATSPLAGT
jgi:hypothetical protein